MLSQGRKKKSFVPGKDPGSLLKPTPGFETKMKAAILKMVKDRELLQKTVDRDREVRLEF